MAKRFAQFQDQNEAKAGKMQAQILLKYNLHLDLQKGSLLLKILKVRINFLKQISKIRNK